MGQLHKRLDVARRDGAPERARRKFLEHALGRRSRIARRDRVRRTAPDRIASPPLSDRLDRKIAKKTPDGRRRPAFDQRTFDVDPFDGDPPAWILLGTDPPEPAAPALFVVVGVERTEIEQLPALEVRHDLHQPRLVGRHVKVGEQALGLEVGSVELQPRRPAGRLIRASRDAYPVSPAGGHDPLPENGWRIVVEDHDRVRQHAESLLFRLLGVVPDALFVLIT